jgi:hypothetical protein
MMARDLGFGIDGTSYEPASSPPQPKEAQVAYAFDTLGYAKKLRDAGVPQQQAEAHAEAAREFVMAELVTKTDLALSLDNLKLALTVRLGAMLAAGIALLGAINKLT